MPNSFFQFKQFRVEQDRCGMKVSSDACILGAYTSYPSPQNILDIGTGTGLLSLMLAQRYPTAQIDAVEIDPDAHEQSSINTRNSPWARNINIHFGPVQEFKPGKQYDLIICNPPFYPKQKYLQSKDPQRRMAFHQDTLSFPELAQTFRRFLSEQGVTSVLLPTPQAEEFLQIAKEVGLFCRKELLISEKPFLPPHRCIRFFGHSPAKELQQERLNIRSEDGAYSTAFIELLKDYYLIF